MYIPAADDILLLNKRLVWTYGGLPTPDRPIDFSYIEGLLEGINNARKYWDNYTMPRVAATVCERLIRLHLFMDGNKRTALATTVDMLAGNGYYFTHPELLADTCVSVARGGISFEQLVQFIEFTTEQGKIAHDPLHFALTHYSDIYQELADR